VLGDSPLPFAWYVAPGPYTVRAEKEGYQPAEEERVAAAGATPHLRLTLQDRPIMAGSKPRAVVRREGANPWILASGAVVAVAGATTGFWLRGMANEFDRDADAQRTRIRERTRGDCAARPQPAELVAPCDRLSELLEDHDSAFRGSWIGFGVGAAAAVGTLVYWGATELGEPDEGQRASAPHWWLSAGVSPSEGAISLSGRF
jgi:hypothetical protein